MSADHEDQLSPELEDQFILRLPLGQAARVRQILRSGDATAPERLKLDLSPDARHAVFQVDDASLSARVIDLPCAIGSLKTHDRKTFYKTADVSQMLVCRAAEDGGGDPCSSPEEPAASARAAAVGNRRERENKYMWNHGITPPLKNVRKRRFRKPTRKLSNVRQGGEGCSGHLDDKDVEKEVKRLLRSDAEAISSRWEIVDEETKAVQPQSCIPGLPVPTEVSGHSSSEGAGPENTFRDSGHDQEKDENKDEDEEDGEEEDEEEEEEDDSEDDLERELQAKFIEFSLCDKEAHRSIISGIQKLIHYKEKKLRKIQGKAQRQKDLLGKLENLTLKRHFQSELEQLKLQEKQKFEQILVLQEQLKYLVK